MESSSGNEPSKRLNFEDLSKEDLVQKCYHLLSIAQKAKTSKNMLHEEIQALKDELSKTKMVSSGTEEIINTLTQKNLSLTMSIDELTTKNKSLSQRLEQCELKFGENQEKMYALDNENSSFKRQIHRLVDENEQLLTNLDALEKQIEKLNQLGVEQQNQLLQLEKHQFAEKNDPLANDENMLTFPNELESLKMENEQLNNKIKNFQELILHKDNIITEIEKKLAKKNNIISELNSELQNSFKENSIRSGERTNPNDDEKNKLKEKLKMYHSKIVKLSSIIKILREDKNQILNLSKLYTDQVIVWQNQLQSAKEKFLDYIKNIENENQEIKLKSEELEIKNKEMVTLFAEEKSAMETKFEINISQLRKQIENMVERCDFVMLEKNLEESKKMNLNLTSQVDSLLQEIHLYKKEIEELKKEQESVENLHLVQELELQNKMLLKNINELNEQIEQLNYTHGILNDDLKNSLKDIDEYKLKLDCAQSEKEINTKELNELKNMTILYENELAKLKTEHSIVSESEQKLLNDLKLLKNEKDSFIADIKEMKDKYNGLLEEHETEKSNYEKSLCKMTNDIKSYEELGVKSSEQIAKLIEENGILASEVEQLKGDILTKNSVQKDFTSVECQTDSIPASEMEQQMSDLKRENAELLSDMNEMNQELKERGENISKLQAHCEEILKKLQVYETQANKNIDNISEKEKIIEELNNKIAEFTSNKSGENVEEITQLKSEIETLKEKLNQNFDSSIADNETMSTSTISKTEEMNRLKDLEGSWEERYGKLRNLALKLKGKIRELNNTLIQQQNENEELQKKLSVNIKTIQNMQNKCDNLEDELTKSQEECKQYLNRLNQVAHDISKDKQQLASKDEIINDLQQKIDQVNKEKQSTETWKKQVSAKIQMLRKDLEAKELLRKELELKLTELNSELQKKDEILKTEAESHNHTKGLLDQLNDQCKKNSMLNLEMQDYERSMKEITKKLDKQQEQIVTLKNQIDSQKVMIETLKEGNKALEENLGIEQQNLLSANSEIEMYKNKISKLEENLNEKDDTIQNITKLSEKSRAEVEELSIELSKTITEHQKTNENLRNERDQLRSQTVVLQQNIRDVQSELNMKMDELMNIQKEYEGYKIRAQSVLRQNQNRDIGFEEKLLEEINSLKAQNISLQTELGDYK